MTHDEIRTEIANIDQLIDDLLNKKKIGMVIHAKMNVLDNDEDTDSVDTGMYGNASINEMKIMLTGLFRFNPELLGAAVLAIGTIGEDKIKKIISSIPNNK